MLGTFMVLELKGISPHSNSGEVTESKALRRILRFLKSMGSTGTDLTAFMEALCQSLRFSWPVSSQMKRLQFCQLQEFLLLIHLRLYVETVEVLSRILAD
ncbi:hypothetical protein DPEC_G00069730 [Dallia pectoralis]|uniref:Uncharacterized protein n=1 Tax=Dallia pectoralis TaxID=75939 RepID=A0ACC2H1S5_DALPE|nr:hypothetical protein DPEC_G00069730 [Dallia pectoralis]